MYSRLQIGIKFLDYYFSALNGKGHGTHSPFVFEFITTVLNDKRSYPDYDKVEQLRKEMLHDNRILSVRDFGAGSSINSSSQRTVSSIASHAAKPKKYGQLLYRIIKKYQPQTIVELGTSLGITTSYLALANPGARLITMEGANEIANVAKENFTRPGLQPLQLIEGDFDNTLPAILKDVPVVDFAFIDGNHRKAPTENYFYQLLAKTNTNSILIFDDIHWSREMEQAWHAIQSHPSVRCTIDLFFIGLVFFREEFKEKQHFRIRF